MPPENRVGRDDRGDLTESATAQPVSVYGQSTTFLIGQADPAAKGHRFVLDALQSHPSPIDQDQQVLPSVCF